MLGVATKAKLSSVFVSLFLFLIGFVTGIIPPDIIKVAGLSEMGKWATCFIVFSMGTTINLRELLAEWRTVATAVLSMLSLTVAGFALVPLIGYEETIVAIPILNGGIVATQMMTTAAMEQASRSPPPSARFSTPCRSSWAPRSPPTSVFAKRTP